MKSFFRKLTWLAQRRRKEAELNEELQFHLAEDAEERQAEGSAEEARWAARRELGNVALLQENTRAAWGWTFFEQLAQDLRYAFRTMAANKTFSALAILSLALGIGANTAIYSFMDAILLRSLPVSNPESLVVLNWHNKVRFRGTVMHGGSGSVHTDPKTGSTAGIFPFPVFELLRKSDSLFSSIFAYYPTRQVHVLVKEQAALASGEYVSGDYFSGLALPPAAGRVIIPDDDRVGAPAIAVLSFAFSQTHFGDAGSAPGQSILINNVPFTVAGVAPQGFFGVDPAAAPDFYIPLHSNFLLKPKEKPGDLAKDYLDQNYYWIEMMARLRPGVSLVQAQAALGPAFHQWVAATASNDQERAHLPELVIREGASGLDTLRQQYSKPLYLLLAIVGLILAIACANIASLLLARATARRREMAIRLSLGAGRFRVIRQLLTESVLLASIGGALGVLFAVWGIRFLTFLLANGREDFTLHPDLNWHVLAAAVALSLLTGLLFGLAPALQATRVDVIPALKEARAGHPRSRHSSWRPSLSHVFVVSQIGISLLMLVAAGLFVRTLSNLQSIQLGFNREGLLLLQMNARQAGHKDPEIVSFYTDLQKRFSAIPGVRSASVSHSPLLGHGTWMSDVVPVGTQPRPDVTTHILMTGPEFFSTIQIPVLRGRAIDERDRPGSPPVAVVNEAYVKTNFGDRNPLGQHVVIGRRPPFANQDVEIVGVVKNARYGDITGEFPDVVYVPFNQGSYYPVDEMTFALRTSGDPLRFAGTVREIVRQADSHVPVTNVKTEAAQIDQTMNQEIIFARLCTGFAMLALIIACIGLYGTTAYAVARRTGEIGIRMALGAQRGVVVWMVLREVFLLIVVGLAISLPTALGMSKVVASFLYGIKPNDPRALTMAVVTLLAAALLAGWVPARKASRIDPMIALRHE
jgi:macrolide transport system ATP-binding/permease protein